MSNNDYWTLFTRKIRESLHILQHVQTKQCQIAADSDYSSWASTVDRADWKYIGLLPPVYPERLGSQAFLAAHQVRFPYVVGEMANGIATARMVIAAVKAGMMGFFGAAGLMPDVIEKNLHAIQTALGSHAGGWGSNLIHSPQEPALEGRVVDLYVHYGVERISASAYMSLTPHIVYCAAKGLTVGVNGEIIRRRHILAKVSRPETAQLFMSPPPTDLLDALVRSGKLTVQEAQLAANIPVAQDITVEADSGGHTDNRPLVALFPTLFNLAQSIQSKYNYPQPIRLGAAGGLGTPASVAAAFSLGAAYVLTGSINQSAVESGLSEEGRMLLAKAGVADVVMAPASDMFELGVKLQVLQRGCLFAARANKLYELYTRYDAIEAIPEQDRRKLETQIFAADLSEIWERTKQFFSTRDAGQITLAEQDPKHKMALIFRWYLGCSSHWAIQGDEKRKADYQIWCGPAMGAFNAWVADSFLENIQARTIEQISRNLLEGAAIIQRCQQLRSYGFPVPETAFHYSPELLA